MTVLEASAAGVPVIATRSGGPAEIIDDGVTGFVVETVEEAIDAVRALDRIDRDTCREVFERRFSVTRMALDYVRMYEAAAGAVTSDLVA
jgi:glycosyltransferase involved in cell wall biosynthesis